MNQSLIITGLLCFLIGAAAGVALGIYLSAKSIAKMIKDDKIIYKEQKCTKN